MASSKTKNRARAAARRPPPRRSNLSAYALPLAVLALSVIVALAIVVLYKVSSGPSGTPAGETVANIPCNSTEQLATHYHAHLDILYHLQPVKLPASIGIQATCLYWTHTHDDTGVIHIEAPKSAATRKFKLGEFFKVWGQPLNSKQVATINVAAGDQVKAWVNGQPYLGDPAGISLASKEQVVIEIGPPFDPPPTFAWDPNQYSQ